MSKTDDFIDFYLGNRPNENGMTFEEILSFSEKEREIHHNFIQWLFPLEVPSPVCPHAPLVTSEMAQAFKTEYALKENLLRATKMMLSHYGLKLSIDQILPDEDFEKKKKNISGHNLLRVTRILKSLVLLGQRHLSHIIFVCLNNLAHESMPELQETIDKYWRSASQL